MDPLRYSLHRPGGGGPALVFLHGFMGSAEDWAEVVADLAQDYTCITVDLPGHGASAHISWPDSDTVAGVAAGVLAVLDRENLQTATIVGYSMGGRLALYLALRHPTRFTRAVIESASPGLTSEDEQLERRGIDEARALRLETGPFEDFLEDWYRQPLFRTLIRRRDLLDRMMARRRRNNPEALARSLRAFGTGVQPSFWAELDSLTVPVLVVVGAEDGKYTEIAARMSVASDRIRVSVIQDAGHTVHAELPDVFCTLVREFTQPHILPGTIKR